MTFSIIILTTLLCTPTVPTPQEVVEQALAARATLRNEYHVQLTITWYGEGKQNSAKNRSKVEVWVKGDKRRTDETRLESTNDPGHVGIRSIVGRNCERQGYGLYTRTGSNAQNVGTAMVVKFYPLDEKNFHVLEYLRADWPRLGQLLAGINQYTRHPADTLLKIAAKSTNPVTEEAYAGQKCLVISWPLPMSQGGVRKCYFNPAYAMNPVRFVDEVPSSRFRQETTITYAKLPGTDVWFPKTLIHTTEENNIEASREEIAVDRADMNAAVPDSVFTLAGLNLDYGQPIAFPELKITDGFPSWSKNGLDWENNSQKGSIMAYNLKMKQQAASAPPVPDRPPTSSRWLYFVAAGILAGLAVAIAIVLRRTRTA